MKPDSIARNSDLVDRVLQSMAGLYYSPSFCISYRKGKDTIQEFYSLYDKDKCYSRIRELRSKSNIRYLNVIFHFHLEVDKI